MATVTIVATIAGALGAAAGIAVIREHGHGTAGSLNGKGDSYMRIQAMQTAVITAAAVTTAVAAQDGAVQWRVENGGNGHWYAVSPQAEYWTTLGDIATATGGHLATITSREENDFVFQLLPAEHPSAFFIGGIRSVSGTWSWVTGEPWQFTNWDNNEPNGTFGQITWIHGPLAPSPGTWNDHPAWDYRFRGVIEYENDCNNDGIVDYGQIRAGDLEDTNANNVPDCCELGTPCNCPADLNGDGLVNGADIGAILAFWGPNPVFAAADITRDGQVNGADLGALLASWGACGS